LKPAPRIVTALPEAPLEELTLKVGLWAAKTLAVGRMRANEARVIRARRRGVLV
jgi:hypothetical protein